MGSALVCVVLGVGPKFEPNKFGGVGKKSRVSSVPQAEAQRQLVQPIGRAVLTVGAHLVGVTVRS